MFQKITALIFLSFMAIGLQANADVQTKTQTRCGWLHNPTPANWLLADKDGNFWISMQGGKSIPEEDWDNMPVPIANQNVRTNGSYGYSCACLNVTIDLNEGRILRVHSGKALPLVQCQDDRTLPEPD